MENSGLGYRVGHDYHNLLLYAFVVSAIRSSSISLVTGLQSTPADTTGDVSSRARHGSRLGLEEP